MASLTAMLTATRGRGRLDWTDWLSYVYLVLGLVLMFGPVLWMVLSSFKTPAALTEFPPQLLPYGQAAVQVAGHDKPLLLYRVTQPDGSTRELAEVRRIGITSTMVDPQRPDEEIKVNIKDRQRVREFSLATGNYTEIFGKFTFGTFLWNSVFITIVATLITLLINAMAAFALSKYRFHGHSAVFLLIISTLMIPPTIILVPNFLVISELGLLNSLWGVIWPAVATPTGVFLLRQYMLTIPDELHRRGAHGQRERVADLLADRASAFRAGARRTGDFFGDVALERLPVAADRAVEDREIHAAARAQCVPGRTARRSGTTCSR